MRGAINKEERFMKKLLKSVAALSLSAMMLLSPVCWRKRTRKKAMSSN